MAVQIPVIREKGKLDKEIYLLDVEDICGCTTEGNNIILFTKDDKYYFPRSFDEVHLYLETQGHVLFGKNTGLRIDKVKQYDEELRIVYFEEDVTPQTSRMTIPRRLEAAFKKLCREVLSKWKK